jgi:hypothetical protein
VVGRLTALPFELVHVEYFYPERRRTAQIRWVEGYLEGESPTRQRVRRMGGSHEAPSQKRDRL